MSGRPRGLATRMGLAGPAKHLYHEPREALRRLLLDGGPIERRRTERGRLAMIEAAKRLRPIPPPPGGNVNVHVLSGARYWYQTLFCLVSLQRRAVQRVTPIIYDDGSFTDETVGFITKIIPWASFEGRAVIEARLDDSLPFSRFPTLRARRLDYPHLRKLTDVHAGGSGWKVVLDSDMIFFREPDALLAWLCAPDRPCHMVDVATAYGYSPKLMQRLAGTEVPERVNVGICGLQNDAIDWDWLEFCCRSMLELEGPSYLQEQALTALLVSRGPACVLPETDYVVRPSVEEGRRPTGVLHHYVAESKRSYFQFGWRLIAAPDEPAA